MAESFVGLGEPRIAGWVLIGVSVSGERGFRLLLEGTPPGFSRGQHYVFKQLKAFPGHPAHLFPRFSLN